MKSAVRHSAMAAIASIILSAAFRFWTASIRAGRPADPHSHGRSNGDRDAQ